MQKKNKMKRKNIKRKMYPIVLETYLDEFKEDLKERINDSLTLEIPKNYDVDTIAEFLYQYDNKSTTINNLIDILEQHKKLLDADYVDYIKNAQKLVTFDKNIT